MWDQKNNPKHVTGCSGLPWPFWNGGCSHTEGIWHLTGATVTVNNFRVLEMLKIGQQSLFLLFQIPRKFIIQASFNICILSFGDSQSCCWSWSPRGLAVHSLRWRTQSLFWTREWVSSCRRDYSIWRETITFCFMQQKKCERYWAEPGETQLQFGPFSIFCVSMMHFFYD